MIRINKGKISKSDQYPDTEMSQKANPEMGTTIKDAVTEGDEIITIKKASVLLGVSLDTLRNMDKDGRLKSYRRSSTSSRREYLLSHVLGMTESKVVKKEKVAYADLILGLNKSVLSGKKEEALAFVDKIKKFLMTDFKSSSPSSIEE